MAETQEPDRANRAAVDALPQLATVQAHMDGRAHDTPVLDRDAMLPGNRITGPAIIREQTATTVVEPGWQAELTAKSHLVLTRVVPLERTFAVGTECDPVMLEVFNNLFMSIAEQMGVTLENTAYSVNIKERLDFSCAMFDPDGNLVANAPHIPIHLGSMGQSVRTVLQENRGALKPGDVYVVNAPYNGGTHLPDVTVITPIFDEAGEEILFFVCEPRPPRRYRAGARRAPRRRTAAPWRRRASSSTTSSWWMEASSSKTSCVRTWRRDATPRASPTTTSPISRRRSPPATGASARSTA